MPIAAGKRRICQLFECLSRSRWRYRDQHEYVYESGAKSMANSPADTVGAWPQSLLEAFSNEHSRGTLELSCLQINPRLFKTIPDVVELGGGRFDCAFTGVDTAYKATVKPGRNHLDSLLAWQRNMGNVKPKTDDCVAVMEAACSGQRARSRRGQTPDLCQSWKSA